MRPLDTRLALLLLALGLAAGLVAQTGSAQPKNIVFRHFDGDEGLHSTVHAIIQDRQGFLWFGLPGGITKFDGYRFSSYRPDPDNPNSVRGSNIRAFVKDRQGLLWMGGWNTGLSRFDPATDTFTHYAHDKTDPGTLSNDHVADLLEDRQGTLWISTRDGVLHRLDREAERFTRFPLNAAHLYEQEDQWPGTLHEDPQGRLWIGTWGLHRFDPDAGTFRHYLPDPRYPAYRPREPNLLVNAVTSILDDEAGGLWVGTMGGGLYRFEPTTGLFTHHFTHDPANPASLSHNDIRALHKDSSGDLWVGTFGGGLNTFDPTTETFAIYRPEPGDPRSLSDDDVLSLYEDRQGGLWIGTFGGGVNYFDRSKQGFAHYEHDPTTPLSSLGYNEVYGIYEDHEGVLWVATVGRGVNRFDRKTGTWTYFRHDSSNPTSVSSDNVFYFQEDRDGVLWIGARNGLNSFDRATETFTHYDHIDNTICVHLFLDSSGTLWVDSDNGVYRFDPATKTVLVRYPHDPDDPSTMTGMGATVIFEDHAGTIWLGAGGLNRFDRETETFTRYQNDPDDPNSLSRDPVYHIEERQREPGILWIATYGGGLNRFDTSTGQFTRFTEQNSDLPNNRVYAALEDGKGRLWISTENGLSRFTPETGAFKNYGLEDGLQGMEFEVQSYFRSESGEMFFGGQNGFNAFFPNAIRDNPHPPQVALTDLKLFNESVPVGADTPLQQHIAFVETITLAHDRNDLSFEYAGLHYSAPERNQYAYKLDGYDDAWRAAGTQRTATYTALPPGDYVFRVKASNSDGVWNEEGASVQVTILPPWWRTLWAYAGYGLLFLAGLVAMDRVQRRRLLRKERERTMQRELEQARQIETMNVQLRQHEQQLEDQNRKLLELDQLKSRFFANISHEFRTPLTLLLGPLNDALSGDRDGERLLRQAPFMRRSARRLLRLVNQLLDLSRLETGGLHLHAQPTDLGGFLRRLVLAFSSRANREEITLLYDGPEEGGLVGAVDRDKLEKVVTNLLSNAIKFTPRGGKVRVALRAIPPASAPDGASSDGGAEILVEDTGRGIPPEALPKVFDRFYQVDSSATRTHEGSGIGLALTKELVELHGGTITVASKEGFGTSFTVRLPLISFSGEKEIGGEPLDPLGGAFIDEALIGEEAVEMLAEPAQLIPDPFKILDMPKILIVEDNADMRAYLGDLLRGEGYHVEEARDGQEGLDRAGELVPDLIISDIMMPRLDGFALCRAIKTNEALSHLPVVLLTAKAAEEDRLEGLEAGADDYLYKPFSAEELLLRTENLIEIRRRLRARFSDEVRLGPSEIALPSSEAVFVEQVREAVEANLSDGAFTMEQLAEAVGLSLRQLHRRLKASVGLTPAGYVRMMRLERAAQLLEQKAGTVSEVAYAVGFSDADYFSRLFKQTHGISPSQYGTDWTS